MLLSIDFESDVPIYMQLKQQIVEGIASGDLLDGESLPSVRQLAEDIGINLHTVNKAYSLLKNDGFLTMDRRKGAIISIGSNMLTGSYLKRLQEDMQPIIAEAYCRGMKEEQFLDVCSKLYSIYFKEKDHE